MTLMLESTVVCLLWIVVAWRASSALKAARPRALWATFAALAAALTVRVPFVRQAVEDATGAADGTILLMHLFGLTAIGFLLHWISLMDFGEGAAAIAPRSNLLLTGAVAGAMTTVFATVDTASADPFLAYHPRSLSVAVYLILWFAYLGTAMALATRLFVRGARHSPRGLLRAGLAMSAAGCALGVVYSVFRLAFLSDLPRPGMLSSDDVIEDFAEDLQFIAVLLIVLGSSLPAGASLLHHLRQHRRLLQLRPLWEALVDTVPHVVLGTPPRKRDDIFAVKDIPLLLHRRIIEIRDAAQELRAHASQSMHDQALAAAARAGISGQKQQAAAAAVWLRSAQHAKYAGHPLLEQMAPGLAHASAREAEADWLAQVSAAYRSSAVTAITQDLMLPSCSLSTQPPRGSGAERP